MPKPFTLEKLPPGQKAVVFRLLPEAGLRRRFADLGLMEGSLVECTGESPSGDPRAYCIQGAVIAIRNREAGSILLKEPDQT